MCKLRRDVEIKGEREGDTERVRVREGVCVRQKENASDRKRN